jgi:hypothetical protein
VFLYANAGKSALKRKDLKRSRIICRFLITDLRWLLDESIQTTHLGYCFNTDCVDFGVPLGILLLEAKQLM